MKQKREGYVQVFLDEELRTALHDRAVAEDRTLSALIRRAIRQYLGIKKRSD